MRKLRLHLLILLLSVPIVSGCEIFNLDINEDPDAALAVEGDLLFPTALVSIASSRAIEIGPANAFFSQIWASEGSTGVFIDPDQYVLSSFMIGNTWFDFYDDALKNLKRMEDAGIADARPNVAAQAEFMSAYVFWALTSLWEDVPHDQALQFEEFPRPEYNTQQEVLESVIMRVDSAIGLLDRSADARPAVVFEDLVYGGDLDLWEAFGNSLKLRVYMMMRNQVDVDAEIQALFDNEGTSPLIRANSETASLPWFDNSGNENPVWKLNNLFGGFTDELNGNFFISAGAEIVDSIMKPLNDPRLDTYFELPVNNGEYYPEMEHFGQLPGANAGNQYSSVSQNILRPAWPTRMITPSEVYFYEAEFLADNGDLAGAEAAYETGIQLAIDWFDGKPGEIDDADRDAYIASLPDLDGTMTQQEALEAIWTQQYIEVFDRAPENWTQWRRVHYPDLVLPTNAVLGDIIRRFSYPVDERSANPNVPDPVPLATPMWFEPN